MQKRLVRILFTTLLFISFTASGQKLVNSPFSRFNLGSLEPAANFRSLGMGGTGTALRDNTSIYYSNPASYGSLDTSSFLFDFGIDYGRNFLNDGSSKFVSDDFNFDHLLMGFPILKGWGASVGIVNLANGYYNISETVVEGDPDYSSVTGAYATEHSGEGGFTSFFIGTGADITRNFSAGVNLSVLFGNVRRQNQLIFEDFSNMTHYTSNESLQLSGANLDFGVQYRANLKNNYFFTAGLSYSLGKEYKSDFESLTYRFTAYGSSDTINYESDDEGIAFIPGTLKAGVSFGKKDKLTAGFDYIQTKWSEADFHGSTGYVADTKAYLFGVEYIPEKLSNTNILRRMEYRIGARFADNYLIINGEQIKEYGISAGLGIPMQGIPMRRSLSKTNLFVDLTRKSAPGSVIHNENYLTFGVSLNFYDFWFIKRKYN